MTLAEVKEYLKSKVECPAWYVGKRDTAAEKSITVYPADGPPPIIPVGGLDNKSWHTKAVSILIHWGKYATPAEEKAQKVYDLLFGQKGEIGEYQVIKFDMRTSEPVGVGTDDARYYEYVINFIIYYKKKGR